MKKIRRFGKKAHKLDNWDREYGCVYVKADKKNQKSP